MHRSRFLSLTWLDNLMKTFREYISELTVRDASGKQMQIKKVPIRMASGKIEMQYPGKSGSSGGGGD